MCACIDSILLDVPILGAVASLANDIAEIVACSAIYVSRGGYSALPEELRDALDAWLALHRAIPAIVILSEVNTSRSMLLIVVIRGTAPLRETTARNLVLLLLRSRRNRRRLHRVFIHIRNLKAVPWIS